MTPLPLALTVAIALAGPDAGIATTPAGVTEVPAPAPEADDGVEPVVAPALDLRIVGGPSVAFDSDLGATRGGFAVDLETPLVGRLRAGFGFALRLGGVPATDAFITEAGARARLAFLPGNDLVGVGPALSAEVAWLRVEATRRDGVRGAVSLPVLRISPGVELRVGRTVQLSVSVAADALPLRGRALRRSDEALLHDTGTIGLTVFVGARIPLSAGPRE